jgi:hypothetical protein
LIQSLNELSVLFWFQILLPPAYPGDRLVFRTDVAVEGFLDEDVFVGFMSADMLDQCPDLLPHNGRRLFPASVSWMIASSASAR